MITIKHTLKLTFLSKQNHRRTLHSLYAAIYRRDSVCQVISYWLNPAKGDRSTDYYQHHLKQAPKWDIENRGIFYPLSMLASGLGQACSCATHSLDFQLA